MLLRSPNAPSPIFENELKLLEGLVPLVEKSFFFLIFKFFQFSKTFFFFFSFFDLHMNNMTNQMHHTKH